MKRLTGIICFCLLLLCFKSNAQVFEVDTLQYQGTTTNMINFVILGDGYTQSQLGQFAIDAQKFKDYLFSQSPYSHYRQYFNVFIVKVPSLESGVKHAHIDADCPKEDTTGKVAKNPFVPISNPNNYFGSSFDNSGLHRLVVPGNQAAIRKVLKDNFPNYSQVVILANSPFYGGSGGAFATATVNKASNDVAIHELGHSFASLADEYWPGLQFLKEDPNRSQYSSPDMVRWKKWVGTNEIGVYSYGGSAPNSVWFRPSESCKMQYLTSPFCSVCSEAIILKIQSLTNSIVKTFPDVAIPMKADSLKTIKLQLAKPDPNTLKVSWYLNGKMVASNVDSIRVNPGFLTIGQNTVSVTVMDTTNMVRADTVHKYEAHWTINNNIQRKLTPPSVRWGDSVQACYGTTTVLTVKNPQAGFKYNWYKDETSKKPIASGTNFITGAMTATTTFYLEGMWEKQKTQRVPVIVKVLPEINAPGDVLVENIPGTDSVKMSITNPDPNLNYRWYESETGAMPIVNNNRNFGLQKYKIARNGTTLEAVLSTGNAFYYVEAVSKTTTCFSKRKPVEVKKAKKESDTSK